MSKQLRKPITEELHRRHGYKVMEVKIKPVHIANALRRRGRSTRALVVVDGTVRLSSR